MDWSRKKMVCVCVCKGQTMIYWETKKSHSHNTNDVILWTSSRFRMDDKCVLCPVNVFKNKQQLRGSQKIAKLKEALAACYSSPNLYLWKNTWFLVTFYVFFFLSHSWTTETAIVYILFHEIAFISVCFEFRIKIRVNQLNQCVAYLILFIAFC